MASGSRCDNTKDRLALGGAETPNSLLCSKAKCLSMQLASGARQMCPEADLRLAGNDRPRGTRDLNVTDSHGSWVLSAWDTRGFLFFISTTFPQGVTWVTDTGAFQFVVGPCYRFCFHRACFVSVALTKRKWPLCGCCEETKSEKGNYLIVKLKKNKLRGSSWLYRNGTGEESRMPCAKIIVK